MTDREKMAMEFFDQGYNCAQGVLLMQTKRLALDEKVAAGIAAAFGGGINRTGNVCGAVTGALMALGLEFGNKGPGEKAAKERAFVKADQFVRLFQDACGSIVCRDLLGVDLSQPGVLEKAREDKLFQTKCPRFVSTAAAIVESMPKDGK